MLTVLYVGMSRRERCGDNRLRSLTAPLILTMVLLGACASTGGQPALPDTATMQAEVEQAMEAGDLDAAQESVRQLLGADPQDVGALQVLLRLHTTNDNEAGQRAVAQQILTISPQHGLSLERLGMLALANGQLSAATDYLKRAVEAEPERWGAWNGLGIVADARGSSGEAEEHFRRGLEVIPGHPTLLANLGWSKLLAGQPVEAERLMRQAMESAPDDLATRSNLAFCIALQGRYDEATQVYRSLYEASVAANNVGYAALLRDDGQVASRYFREAMKLEPSFYRKAANNLELVESIE